MSKSSSGYGCLVVLVAGIVVIFALMGGDRRDATPRAPDACYLQKDTACALVHPRTAPSGPVESPPVAEVREVHGCDTFVPKNVHGTVDELGFMTIRGQIKNVSVDHFSYIEITFNTYDENDNRVGTAMANVNDLGPGEIWRFTAVSMGDHATRYRAQRITCF